MRGRPAFREVDLDHLNEQIGAAALAPADYTVWQELLSLGRELVRARETAEAAGLIAGSTPSVTEIGDIADAFRRSSGTGTRAIVGNVPPRR